MRYRLPARAITIISAAFVFGIALLAGAIIVAWTGVYDVAASSGHWPIVQNFLEFGMRNSIAVRALAAKPPPLDNPDLIRLGAAHFHRGCAFCHGAPGIPVNPIAKHMLPPPPEPAGTMRPGAPNDPDG